jgi:hypothetical protein
LKFRFSIQTIKNANVKSAHQNFREKKKKIMSSTRTEPYNIRNPPTFGKVEEALVGRGHATQAIEKLRPFSATGAKALNKCIEKRTSSPEQQQHELSVISSQHHHHKPYDLLPWESQVSHQPAKNPFAKNAVTSHLPHVAKSTSVRRVPLTHLGLAMEIDDTVGLPSHKSTWGARNDARAASLGQFLVQSMGEEFPDDDDDDDDNQEEKKQYHSATTSKQKKNTLHHHHHHDFGIDLEASGVSSSSSASRSRTPELNDNEQHKKTQYSLAQAANRTKSMYLSRLQSVNEENTSASSKPSNKTLSGAGRKADSQQQQQQQELHQHAMKSAFEELASRKNNSMSEDESKRLLVALYKEHLSMLIMLKNKNNNDNIVNEKYDDDNDDAKENEAMQDVPPPSSGFETHNSNNTTDKKKHHEANSTVTKMKPMQQQQQQHQQQQPIHSLSSGRGFFLNGKQRNELVHQVLSKTATATTSTSTTVTRKISPPQQHPPIISQQQQQQNNNASSSLDDNDCKYHEDSAAQRAIHRSWKFRDQLHLRHSVKASHLPRNRRTIINSNTNSPNGQLCEVISGSAITK